MATNSRLTTVLIVAGLVLAVGVGSAGQANPRVAARDQLSITVWGVKAFTNKYPVGIDGMLEFPEIGRLKVVGLTVREVGDLLATKLKEREILINPQVTVELEQTANKKVTVNGLVRSQGAVPYAGEITLLDALVRAGGRLPEAADEVLILRTPPADAKTPPSGAVKPITFEVNAREIENGVLTNNLVLQDGDAIFVRKAEPVTVTGYVRSVGAYTIQSGMNVEQVLALAGGIDTTRGSDKRIEITRKVNGKSVTLKDVKKTDLVKPGDIIRVGRRIA